MGMSTHVIAFSDDNSVMYKKHYKVMVACEEAGIEKLPYETAKFFGFDYPDLYQAQEELEIPIKTHEYRADMEDGYEIIVSEIPEGVYKIRFYNSY